MGGGVSIQGPQHTRGCLSAPVGPASPGGVSGTRLPLCSRKPRDLVGGEAALPGVIPVHLEKGLPGLCGLGYLGNLLQGTS